MKSTLPKTNFSRKLFFLSNKVQSSERIKLAEEITNEDETAMGWTISSQIL